MGLINFGWGLVRGWVEETGGNGFLVVILERRWLVFDFLRSNSALMSTQEKVKPIGDKLTNSVMHTWLLSLSELLFILGLKWIKLGYCRNSFGITFCPNAVMSRSKKTPHCIQETCLGCTF